ncbi:MAG: chemotaxis protein CheX, partial [Lentisphaerota bacterium]
MDTEALQMAEQAFCDVLERFAFMFSEPLPAQELKPPETDFCRATIGFDGPRKGTLAIGASAEVCEMLAANILGMEPRMINREAGEDSFKEVLNVTCGEFLEHLAGPESVFDLTVP